jgi:penicillin-binding protein 2
MLNTPHNTIFELTDKSEEFIAPGSTLRLWLIGALFSISAMIVLARVAWVQTQLPADYLESLTATTIEEELIPARDGRILTESVVLAADVEQYAVQIHYRWLQSSADPGWLKQQVRQRLTREERKETTLVAKSEQEILSRRDAVLRALSEATQVTSEELMARRDRIEDRVQKISDAVNLRHSGADVSGGDEESRDDQSIGFLIRWASSIRMALTTPPQREDQTRIVVKEEESWHTILENVPVNVAAQISEHPEIFPGVRVVTSTQRTYPANDLAVHLVGARTKLTSEEHEESDAGSSPKAGSPAFVRVGRFGVEKSYNSRLTGIPGVRQIVRDRRQRIVSSEVTRKPVSGRDTVLTMDVELQTLAEQLLAESLGDAERRLLLTKTETALGSSEETLLAPPEPEHIPTGGCVVVMEVDTGRIVAAASAPDFDLALFTEGTEAQWQAVNSDARRPFVSRFSGMALPPGSTFKIVTAIAGLQSGALASKSPFICQGFLNNPNEHRCLIFRLHGTGHGSVNLRTAMAQSCNVYFFDAARRMGIDSLTQWTEQLEFGKRTGIDLPFEKSGTVPSAGGGSTASTSEAARRRFERDALGLAIGQSRLTVTPIQMARLLAFVANGGWLVTPHVVSDEGTARQASEIDDSPFLQSRHRIPGVTKETLAAVREGLMAAVEEPIGTGFKTVRLPGVKIAGKTGTAETAPGKPDHAWFTGYAPAEDPRYVLVVALEHGGSGSKAAGPIVRELVRSLLKRGMLGETELTRLP